MTGDYAFFFGYSRNHPSQRSCSTPNIASPKMLVFIFEVPSSRLMKMTGTSLILKSFQTLNGSTSDRGECRYDYSIIFHESHF